MDIDAIAAHFYESCCLYEDPSIDPADPERVIDAALLTSDCDDLAWLLAKVTGWKAVTVMWSLGGAFTGHHSVVKAPDGRYLDITGWTDIAEISARTGVERRKLREVEFRHHPFSFEEKADDEGLDALLSAGHALGRTPFTEDWLVSAIAAYRDALPLSDDLDAVPATRPPSV
jgi:hypothetical protein